MSWLHAARTRLRLLADRDAAESRTDDEIRFHLDMDLTVPLECWSADQAKFKAK